MPLTRPALASGFFLTELDVLTPKLWLIGGGHLSDEEIRARMRAAFGEPKPAPAPRAPISYAFGDDPFTGDTLQQKMADDCKNYRRG